MTIPVESSEIQDFVPESLKVMGDAAPVFRLKAPSERCLRRYQDLIGDDGLESFSDAEFTAEKLKAIDLYWSPEDAQGIKDRFNNLLEMNKQAIEIGADDLAWLSEFDDQLFEVHRPLNVMRRKTGNFREYAPRHALSIYLAGWKNLDVPFKLNAGLIEAGTVLALGKEMQRLGREHCPDEPIKPFLDLYVAVTARLYIGEDEEKNSPAPSPPSSSPDASTESVPKAGESSEASAADATSSSSSPRKKRLAGA